MNKLKLPMLLLALLLVASPSFARHAEILINADNGTIMHELDANQSWYPASLTKLMTLYMTFDALKAGQVQLGDSLSASYHAARQPNSRLGLHTGDNISVEQAILALITRSANDASVALAEHLAGTEENFAVKMTAKAHAIGMSDSYFMNATGLPNDLQVSTARDLGLLAWRTLRDFPQYYAYFAASGVLFKGRQLPAINKFTKTYLGAEGMKTGFTCGSGYNLISSASQNGRRQIGVVLGGMSSPQRYQLMIAMMDNGFAGDYGNGSKAITAPTVMNASTTPPYQLGCGRHFASPALDETASSDNAAPVPRAYHYPRASRYHRAVRHGYARSRYHKASPAAHPSVHKAADKRRYHKVSHSKHH